MSCGVGRTLGLDLVLLWLSRRPAAAALTGPLACEPPCATGTAIKRQKKKKKKIMTIILYAIQYILVASLFYTQQF